MGFFSSVSKGISKTVRRARRKARRLASAPKRVAGAAFGGGNLSERIGNVHSEIVRSTPGGKYIEPALGIVMPATPFVKALGKEHGVDWPPASKEDKRKARRQERRGRRRRRRERPGVQAAGRGRSGRGPSNRFGGADSVRERADVQLEVEEESRWLAVARLFGMQDVEDPAPRPPPPRPPGLLTQLFQALF